MMTGPVVMATVLALVLCACGTSGAGNPPSSSATGSSPGGGDRDIERLRDALSAQGSDLGETLDDEATTVEAVDSPFPRWRVLTVDNTGGEHPLQWTFVVNRTGAPRAINLAADAKAWSQLIGGVRIDAADEAVTMASAYVDLTHDAAEGVYRVRRPEDIRWLTSQGKSAKEQVTADRAEVTSLVHGPKATSTSQGWQVTLTAMHQGTLTEHVLTVSRGGDVTDSTRTVARDLAVRVVH